MKNISDEELFMLALEENEDAKNCLFKRYSYIIDIVIKKYSKVANMLRIDMKDLYSEGLYAFSDALTCYNQSKQASIPTFITLCIDRRIQTFLIKAGRKKNKILLDALSLDHVYDNFGKSLKDLLSDDNLYEPLSNMTKRESYKELIDDIKNELSDFEYDVFSFIVNDFDYIEIAKYLNKTPKQVDNTIQRIKNKLKNLLVNRVS